eukprot:g32544.t1
MYGQAEIGEMLLASRTDVNITNEYGRSALHFAVSYRQPALVRLLLAAGADRSLQDLDGFTALEIAEKAQPAQRADYQDCLQAAREQLQAIGPAGQEGKAGVVPPADQQATRPVPPAAVVRREGGGANSMEDRRILPSTCRLERANIGGIVAVQLREVLFISTLNDFYDNIVLEDLGH